MDDYSTLSILHIIDSWVRSVKTLGTSGESATTAYEYSTRKLIRGGAAAHCLIHSLARLDHLSLARRVSSYHGNVLIKIMLYAEGDQVP